MDGNVVHFYEVHLAKVEKTFQAIYKCNIDLKKKTSYTVTEFRSTYNSSFSSMLNRKY